MSDQSDDFELVLQDPPALLGRRVLVVDNQPQLKFLAATVLRDAGADVHFASDKREAFFRTSAQTNMAAPFDLVIVSFTSLGDEGGEVCQQLRAQNYRGPILAIGDHANSETHIDAVLPQPMCVNDLLEAADRLLAVPVHVNVPTNEAACEPVVSDLAAFPQMHAMLERFVDELPTRLSEIHEAANAHELGALHEQVLALKQSASNHGYTTIAREAAETDLDLHAADDLCAALDGLTDLCRRAVVQPTTNNTLPPSA